jgi:hypothetical protein
LGDEDPSFLTLSQLPPVLLTVLSSEMKISLLLTDDEGVENAERIEEPRGAVSC